MDNRKINKKEFINLINKNRGIIHKITLMYTSTTAGKEDLYQEICLQLWRSVGNYRGESKVSTWLYRVAINTAINSIRKRSKSINTIELDPERHYITKNNEREHQTAILLRGISRLNKVDRAITLLWLEEKKYEEISEIIGLTRSAVSVRLVRIRKKLEELIKNMENE
ncbi:MAG: sigma-70 family RNA polymerase sigma factor [Bacteroidales bacterium]|nr:sigma-70 family RNA polymerase sigma factor [Bacteroidales bacterium]